MKIGVPKEIVPGERRVALTPDATAALVKSGLQVVVERGAGEGAFHSDAAFEAAGARIVADIYTEADVVLKVQKPTLDEVERLREGTVLLSFLQALTSAHLVQRLAARRITSFGMEGIPRISRAQKMDALSSQANIAGYKAVLIAAESLPRFFPMMMTAAGTVFAARVLVMGAGVAGLQAIATARRLGAQVWGYDVRAAVKEQVESLGAKFLELDLGIADAEDKGGYAKALSVDAARRQQELLAEKTKDFDVVITTALALNFDDEVIKGACVTHGGEIVNDAVKATVAARKTA